MQTKIFLAGVLSAVVVAGCGSNSSGPTGAVTSSGATSAAAGARTTTRAASRDGGGTGPLAFSRCMRANGVPNFPDPAPGEGFQFPANGQLAASPAFHAAQAKCQRLMGGGPPGPGAHTHPSAQALAQMVSIAQCMREHGVPNFPDPRTSVPSNLAGITEISDIYDVILLFPATINQQAPGFIQAAGACHFPLHNH
jgi:hypothetical protein